MNASELRVVERDSIRAFVESNAAKLTGHVLDFGCGKQPYRDIVTAAGGTYNGFDRPGYAGSVVKKAIGEEWPLGPPRGRWDAILCNQVVQYLSDPKGMLGGFYYALKPGGWLVMSGPTNWPEVEVKDIWRITTAGMGYLLEVVGFEEVTVASRETLRVNDIVLSLGWGATARRPG